MAEPEKELLKQVHRWLELADEDLRLAKYALTMKSNVPYRLIGFHSQQAAEKYIKALLTALMIDFPYTHNLEYLARLLEEFLQITNLFPEIANLTNYAVARRYPGEYKKLTRKDAVQSVELADEVRIIIRKQLKSRNFLQ